MFRIRDKEMKNFYFLCFVAILIVACGKESSSTSPEVENDYSSNSEIALSSSDVTTSSESKGQDDQKVSSSSNENIAVSSSSISEIGLSSSNAEPNSSSAMVLAEGQVDPSTVVKGSFVDVRDNKTYKTVKIGNQTWMAENLNFALDSSYCYNDSIEYCDKYGRLYSLDQAKIACPEGWRLPDSTDFHNLIIAAGGKDNSAISLKSRTEDWDTLCEYDDYDQLVCREDYGPGNDLYGFNALPAGYWDPWYQEYRFHKMTAYFWSLTIGDIGLPITLFIQYYNDVGIRDIFDYIGLSVRCIK